MRWIDAFRMPRAGGSRWIDAYRMQYLPKARPIFHSPECNSFLLRSFWTVNMAKAAHMVLVALLQFADYVTDLMVILQLATTAGGSDAEWIVCVVAVVLSLLMTWAILAAT